MPTREFSEPAKVDRRDCSGFYFDCPSAPVALQDAINLQWRFAPVTHALSCIPCVRKTRILDPGAKTGRLAIPFGNASRIDHCEECVTERDEFRRSRTPAGR